MKVKHSKLDPFYVRVRLINSTYPGVGQGLSYLFA